MSKLKITRIKSDIGRPERQRATMKHLGLHKIRSSVVKEDTPEVMGMIKKVQHLIEVEKVDG